jgi:hypothetical protein
MTTSLPRGVPEQGPPEKPHRIDGWVWGFTALLALLNGAVVGAGDLELLLVNLAGLSCFCLPWLALLPCLCPLTGLRVGWYTVAGVGLILLLLCYVTFSRFAELCAGC